MFGEPKKGEWREFDSWPPPNLPQPFFLHTHHKLSEIDFPKPDAPPTKYQYNPRRPTPTLGGALLHRGGRMKEKRLIYKSYCNTFSFFSFFSFWN